MTFICNECDKTYYVFFYVYILISFTSTKFCTILSQFDEIPDGLKLKFSLYVKTILNYARVEIPTLPLRKYWKNSRTETLTLFGM